ncbi:hypothetical protein VP01_191g8 [Puccinia sorghi]|uniref:Uncharacterized protein n=1 Tax=Puccinia sorghi TaxID=27349 RepID=A0A0L6VCQ2_9BASI|nr:hypothetical protein VP01_191g8 [Puccinia sorghi]
MGRRTKKGCICVIDPSGSGKTQHFDRQDRILETLENRAIQEGWKAGSDEFHYPDCQRGGKQIIHFAVSFERFRFAETDSLFWDSSFKLIAGGSYYLIHAHIANRTHLISTSLQDLSYQFRTLDYENSHIQLLLQPTPFQPKPLAERIKLHWNRSILSLSRNVLQFNLADSTDRFVVFLKSKFLTDSNQT